MQPGYLPWLGFFDQMARVDVFVLYDSVQFDKNGWRNRNRIKSKSGPIWLTVPVHSTLSDLIKDVRIDNSKPWKHKHLEAIRQNYSKTTFFQNYFPELKDLLNHEWSHIAELDCAIITLIKNWLNIKTKVVRASEFNFTGSKNERLLNICQAFGASKYLSGNAAKDYLDISMFEKSTIKVEWQDYKHPTYSQLNGEFIPYLSTIDLVFNCGAESLEVLLNERSVN